MVTRSRNCTWHLYSAARFIAKFSAMVLGLVVWSSLYAEQGVESDSAAYPQQVYWGDTHVHTSLSHDAFIMGNVLTPDDAYRFAKGKTVRSSSGKKVRLRRTLDFMMVSDHAENMGVLPQLAAGGGDVPATPVREHWVQKVSEMPSLAEVLAAESVDDFTAQYYARAAVSPAKEADFSLSKPFARSVWQSVIANAERHNDPSRFTTFIGYEWSARVLVPGQKAKMVHRNILFEGGHREASHVLPFSRFDSSDPEDLWAYLQDYEMRSGGRVLAIPHNANLSGGNLFKLATYEGGAFTTTYARTRARWEPIAEVTQIKGDGETHPLASPDDAFADFETMVSPNDEEAQSYARPALKNGLGVQAELGVNPFKFGMIGSTDTHNSLSTARDDNFWGSMAIGEPNPYRAAIRGSRTASGYVAVWATENTRESLFAAMLRREVYASTGPRITLRFFGGWAFNDRDASLRYPARTGYAGGVPMGGDLTAAPPDKAPRFLIRAVKDPDSANLDRVQVIKGWRDNRGTLFERVYDVALSDGREPGQDAAPVGNTVDVEKATWKNSIGARVMSVTWQDPDFNPDELAFYYVRVLEIPTPRWTTYDAAAFGVELPDEMSKVIQERAYSSPIWYTPL